MARAIFSKLNAGTTSCDDSELSKVDCNALRQRRLYAREFKGRTIRPEKPL